MNDLFFILGAPDPEMQAIEDLCKKYNVAYGYAMREGKRVHPGNAYQGDNIAENDGCLFDDRCPTGLVRLQHDCGHTELVSEGSEGAHDKLCCNGWGEQKLLLVAVECNIPQVKDFIHLCDHHRPGDAGYQQPPTNFLPASSIGQVYALFAKYGVLDTGDAVVGQDMHVDDPAIYYDSYYGWVVRFVCGGPAFYKPVPKNIILTAAADHCLGAAYKGECPGVDPEDLLRFRIHTRSDFQKISEEDLSRTIEATRQALRDLINLSELPGGTLPEAPEAACREGVAVIGKVKSQDGRNKLVILGNTTPGMIGAWMEEQNNLGREVYGDSIRGFAGAYLD